MTLRRGFKTEANQIAIEVRKELGLPPHAPLCPWSLAEHLAVPVLALGDLSSARPELADHVDYLTHRHPEVFSAITVFSGHRRLIVHNEAHALTRQRSDLAHEIAHALLLHPPHPPFCTNFARVLDQVLEEEAGWLGPTLLVPNQAASWVMSSGLSDVDAAGHFGVSLQLMQFRLGVSGARKIARYVCRGRAS